MHSTLLRQKVSKTSSSLSDYTISYISAVKNEKDYFHPCFKIIVSLDTEFSCMADGIDFHGRRAVIISPNIMHSLSATNANILVTLVKADSVYGRELNTLLADDILVDLADLLDPEQLGNIVPENYSELTDKDIIPFVENFLNSIVYIQYTNMDSIANKKIKAALDFIDNNLQELFEIEDVAININMSYSRMRHLFTEQMGFPITQYVSWKRIKRTLSTVKTDNITLTEACHKYCFNDQSHFNHTFKLILGLRPREILRSSHIVL